MNERLRIILDLGPRTSPDVIVEQINRIYHKYEAQVYDLHHPEVTQQLPPIWDRMLQTISYRLPDRPLRVLDFGCGTGFEATMILQSPLGPRIGYLLCYDLSPDMLAVCHQKLTGMSTVVAFTSSLDDVKVAYKDDLFDVVATNSLLHHIPDWQGMVNFFRKALMPGGFWLNGHEPSPRCYQNPACVAAMERYRQERQWKERLNPLNWARRLSILLGLGLTRRERIAFEFNRLGLTEKPLLPSMVSMLVDFNVPHGSSDAETMGFDPVKMAEDLAQEWDQIFLETYAHIGPFYGKQLPRRWQSQMEDLRAEYPKDGANFCAVWRRKDI